jgi:hypothetical protein
MAAPKKQTTDSVYVRIPYCGFIPILQAPGPVKSFVKKDDILALVRNGYEVIIVNPASCPEFAKALSDYYAYIKANDIAKAREIAISAMLYDNPITKIAKEAQKNASSIPHKAGSVPNIEKAMRESGFQDEALSKEYKNQLDSLHEDPFPEESPKNEGLSPSGGSPIVEQALAKAVLPIESIFDENSEEDDPIVTREK